jgi:hypothetical protein
MALKRKDTITKNRVKAPNKKFIRDNSTLDSATQPLRKNKKKLKAAKQTNNKVIKIEQKTSSSDLEDAEIVSNPVEKKEVAPTVKATTNTKQTSPGSDNSEEISPIKNLQIPKQPLKLEISKPTQTTITTNSSMKRKLNIKDVENENSKKKNKKVKFYFSGLF